MRATTLEAVKPLGPDYQSRLANGDRSQVDGSVAAPGQAPRRVHEPGAFDVHPYLLLNLSEKYDGLSTYAHEWGHALHSLLADSRAALSRSRTIRSSSPRSPRR